MTFRADARQAWRENKWLRRWVAVAVLTVLNMVRAYVWPLPGDWLPAAGFAALLIVCGLMQGRTAGVLRAARLEAAAKAAREAKELRTLRAPDAGPDQCPVCGCYGLTALAADDQFMDRGPLAKVVAYGGKRAHWDCAEFVPYKPPVASADMRELRPTPLGFGVICTCRFCGEEKHAPNTEAGKARLIEHSKVCTERPRPDAGLLVDRSFRSRDGLAPSSAGRVFTGPDGKEYVSYAPEPRGKSIKAQMGHVEVNLDRIHAEVEAIAARAEARRDEAAWITARLRRLR
jgi:hypothetical protein